MSLTKDDLKAIKAIVDGAIDESDLHTAAGFAEVHEKFANIDKRFDTVSLDLNRIENKLNPTIEQVDDHEKRLKLLEPSHA